MKPTTLRETEFSRDVRVQKPSVWARGGRSGKHILESGAAFRYRGSMSLTLEQLAAESMRLPATLRAELAEKLVGSLDFSEDSELRKTWAAEAIRRRDEVRSGLVQPIPGDEVLAEVRGIVGR